MIPPEFPKRAATNAIAARGGLYDCDPGMAPTRAAGRWVAGEASSEALDRFRSPIHTAAQALCDTLYGFARSGIDPARLGLRSGADELDGWGGELHFGSSSTCLSGLLGWIDLYRRELATPRPTSARAAREIDSCLRNIRMVLADAPLDGGRPARATGFRYVLPETVHPSSSIGIIPIIPTCPAGLGTPQTLRRRPSHTVIPDAATPVRWSCS